MRVKKKFLVGTAVGAASLVVLGGAALAQSTDGDGTTGNSMWDRVAEILGVEPDDLESAVEQARAEEREAKLAEKLAEAVEEGVITQEESDSISAWFAARPAFLDELGGIGKHAHFGLRCFGDVDDLEAVLERLITNEVITEEQAQEIRDWMAARPTEALEKLAPEVGIGGGHHRGFNGHFFGRGPNGGLFEGRFHILPYAPDTDDSTDDGADSSGTSTGVAIGASA
jgi:hypothetical protein